MTVQERDDRAINRALRILVSRAREPGDYLQHPIHIANWFRLKLGGLPYEVFAVAWLDPQHRLIEFQELFRGTIDHTNVHIREVVKSALICGASAGIIAHNHPSGMGEPSEYDFAVTAELIAALWTVKIDLLDHLIVTAKSEPYSMARTGWLQKLAYGG